MVRAANLGAGVHCQYLKIEVFDIVKFPEVCCKTCGRLWIDLRYTTFMSSIFGSGHPVIACTVY